MKLIRIIPILLVQNDVLVKGERFFNHNYIGDIYNAVKIFSEKGAHEIILLDISATAKNETFNIDIIKKIKNEIFVPLTIGGGIKSLDQATKIINEGVEKVCINTALTNNIKLISDIAQKFGSQSTVASIDVKKINEEYFVFFENGSLRSEFILEDYIKLLRDYGAGEIILTSINNEGSRSGFDLELYKRIDKLVNIPIIANGGAKNLADFEKLFSKTNISSASGGACFVYYGSRKAVLINYPNKFEINEIMERYEG